MRTLVLGGTIVALSGELPHAGAPPTAVFVDGEMEVERGRITYVGPRRSAHGHGPCRVVDARGCAVIPGFVQAHVHLCQVLLRGLADDLPLLEWLKERIWPLEAAHDPQSLRASAELGLLEMSLCGTTTLLDMGTVHHQDAVFEAADASDLFVFSGKAMMDVGEDVPPGLRETTQQSLAESDALASRWNGSGGGRLHYAYAPRFILSCSEPMWRALAERLQQGAMVHSHVAEHPGEREAVFAQLGMTDLEALRSYAIRGPRTILAHGVQLTPAEVAHVAADGTRIVHCPSANLKLGSGIAPVWDYWQAGVQLALGADGAPCNNNLDPWMEMRHAALLSKIRTGTTALPAEAALRLATIEGAKALGIDRETGSLEVGKRADFVVARLDGPHVEPGGDVYSRLVYAATSRDVRHVYASGQIVVWDGRSTRFDADKVVLTARAQMKALLARAGL